jgi:hypothetical protein
MAKLSLNEVSKRLKLAVQHYRCQGRALITQLRRSFWCCWGHSLLWWTEEEQKNDQIIDIHKKWHRFTSVSHFMKKEIESSKNENSVFDQIDRFQLLLGKSVVIHQCLTQWYTMHTQWYTMQHPIKALIKHSKNNCQKICSWHNYDTPRNTFKTSHDTPQKQPKKRGLFGRVLNAVFNDDE